MVQNMFFSPITYDEPLFRPPSEGRSLIFQATIGCSWNRCAFCEMYTGKKFRVRPQAELLKEIEEMSMRLPDTRKIFLADGNALVLSANKLMELLQLIQMNFKRVTRISAYAGARDLENKSVEELKQLRAAGLKLLYVGIESGDDEVLGMISKGETFASMEKNLLKAKAAGIGLSVMILNGLGGELFSVQHARNSAALVNRVQPEYLSTLVLSFPYGVDHFRQRFKGEFVQLKPVGLLEELACFISHTNLNKVVFRSDHASNYLPLKGILGRDKDALVEAIEKAAGSPHGDVLRKEWQRGL